MLRIFIFGGDEADADAEEGVVAVMRLGMGGLGVARIGAATGADDAGRTRRTKCTKVTEF